MITITARDVHYMHEVLCIISGNPQLPSPIHGWVAVETEAREEQARRYIEEREERARNYVSCKSVPEVKYPLAVRPEGMMPGDALFPDWFFTDRHRRAIWIGEAMALHGVRIIDIKHYSNFTTNQIYQDLDYLISCIVTAYPKETSKPYLSRRRKGNCMIYRLHSKERVLYTGNYASGILTRFAEELTKQRLSPSRYFKLK